MLRSTPTPSKTLNLIQIRDGRPSRGQCYQWGNAVIALLRLLGIALFAGVLIAYARREKDRLAREANEAREAKELDQWWGAVSGHGHVTEKDAEDAALNARTR